MAQPRLRMAYGSIVAWRGSQLSGRASGRLHRWCSSTSAQTVLIGASTQRRGGANNGVPINDYVLAIQVMEGQGVALGWRNQA
jgi:hypothetical protein